MTDTNKIIDEYLKDPDIHEERKAGLIGVGVSLVVAFVASVAHGVNAYLAFATNFPKPFSVLIHIVVCAFTIAVARALYKMGRDSRFMMMMGIVTIPTGVFGAVGSLFSIIMYFWHMRGIQTFWEWFNSIFPHFDATRPEEVYDDIIFGRDENTMNYSVVPFLDVMNIGSEEQKRNAISRMTERFNPNFAPSFKKALNDESNSIRVQAATSIARIETQFLERLMKISNVAKKHPNDPIITLAIAEHYDNYAFTGILDIERERLNRRRALQNYQAYLAKRPDDLTAKMRYGRLLLRNRQFEEAADWFKAMIEDGTSGKSNRIKGWYIEALYSAKRFSDLREYAKSIVKDIESLSEESPKLVRSVMFWADEDESINLYTDDELDRDGIALEDVA